MIWFFFVLAIKVSEPVADVHLNIEDGLLCRNHRLSSVVFHFGAVCSIPLRHFRWTFSFATQRKPHVGETTHKILCRESFPVMFENFCAFLGMRYQSGLCDLQTFPPHSRFYINRLSTIHKQKACQTRTRNKSTHGNHLSR